MSHRVNLANVERVADALKGLVERLDYVHEDPAFKSVWEISQLHMGPYTGPTYVEALAEARAALALALGQDVGDSK